MLRVCSHFLKAFDSTILTAEYSMTSTFECVGYSRLKAHLKENVFLLPVCVIAEKIVCTRSELEASPRS